MLKRTCYRIYPEKRIVIEYLSGNISWSDLVLMKQEEIQEPEYNPQFNVITDIRDAQLDLEAVDEVEVYLDFLKKNTKSVDYRKTAILTSTSEHVIHAEMLRVMKNDLPINIKAVSTVEAALSWTEQPSDIFWEIQGFINDLKMDIFEFCVN